MSDAATAAGAEKTTADSGDREVAVTLLRPTVLPAAPLGQVYPGPSPEGRTASASDPSAPVEVAGGAPQTPGTPIKVITDPTVAGGRNAATESVGERPAKPDSHASAAGLADGAAPYGGVPAAGGAVARASVPGAAVAWLRRLVAWADVVPRRQRVLVPVVVVIVAAALTVPVLLSRGSASRHRDAAATHVIADSPNASPPAGSALPSAPGATPVVAGSGQPSRSTTGQPAPGAPGSGPTRPAPTAGATQAAAQPTGNATGGTQSGGGSTVDYDAITGNGCIQNSGQGFYPAGRGLPGWVTGTSGGFAGYGCTGRYDSMPLTGSDQHTDNRYQVWWFQTTAVSSANCYLWIFIPYTADATDTASVAHFAVIPNKDSWSMIGTFAVDESSSRGTWAYGGVFPMRSGALAVKLLDQGYGRASAAAALVKCYRS